MKKQLIGAITLITMSVAASAAVAPSSIEGITVSISENCSDGYFIKSEREATSKVVTYDSCLNTGMVVSGGSESGEGAEELPGDTVDIDGTNYYFPNGYITPTVALGETCETGVTGGGCSLAGLTELGEGYLNLVETSSTFHLSGNQLSNLDNLNNLTLVRGYLSLYSNPNLSDLSGLNNIQSVDDHLKFDKKEYDVKLDADSYLCVNFDTKARDQNGNATLTKSNVCND